MLNGKVMIVHLIAGLIKKNSIILLILRIKMSKYFPEPYEVDKLDIDILKILPNNLGNLKSKVDKLDIDKLVPVPVDLCKLSNVVKNEVVKKTE